MTDQIHLARLIIIAALAGAITFMAGVLVTKAEPAECDVGVGINPTCDEAPNQPTRPAKPAAFRPWQRAWQCNDIRVTETVTQRGIVNYDLGGTIWGGSQFALDIQRGTMWFNGRPCTFLGGTQ